MGFIGNRHIYSEFQSIKVIYIKICNTFTSKKFSSRFQRLFYLHESIDQIGMSPAVAAACASGRVAHADKASKDSHWHELSLAPATAVAGQAVAGQAVAGSTELAIPQLRHGAHPYLGNRPLISS